MCIDLPLSKTLSEAGGTLSCGRLMVSKSAECKETRPQEGSKPMCKVDKVKVFRVNKVF